MTTLKMAQCSSLPKTRQKGEIFSMMHVLSHIICLKCIFIYLRTGRMPLNALVLTLRSQVDIIWIRAI